MDATASRVLAVLLCGTWLVACSDDSSGPATPTPTVFSASGDIAARVDEFRQHLGGLNNDGTPGEQSDGRREINWDGVPDDLAAPFDLPGDYFNGPAAPLARGAVLATPGTAVQVSADADNPAGAAVRSGNINPSYVTRFRTFSPERLFSPVGSNIVDLRFFVAGTTSPAAVRGFGAVYTGVDAAVTSTFEYFEADGRSLGLFPVPVSTDGLSFLGVAFDDPIVRRVRITYGNSPLGPDDAHGSDVAVMDDFIFGEPKVVP